MKRGFTLIELLVVIGIVSILAGILLPVISNAREKGRQAACVSNLHQIALACTMYAQDNDGKFFPDPGDRPWSSFLGDYNEASIYNCPTGPEAGNSSNPEYGFNAVLFGKSTAGLVSPDSVIVAADLKVPPLTDNYALAVTSQGYEIDPRHNRGAVIAAADGHTVFVTAKGGLEAAIAGVELSIWPSWMVIQKAAATATDPLELGDWGTKGYWVCISDGTVSKSAPSWVSGDMNLKSVNASDLADHVEGDPWWSFVTGGVEAATVAGSTKSVYCAAAGTQKGVELPIAVTDARAHSVIIVLTPPAELEGSVVTFEVLDEVAGQGIDSKLRIQNATSNVITAQLSFAAETSGATLKIRVTYNSRKAQNGVTAFLFD